MFCCCDHKRQYEKDPDHRNYTVLQQNEILVIFSLLVFSQITFVDQSAGEMSLEATKKAFTGKINKTQIQNIH